MKEEEVLYHQSGSTITCIIWRKNNTPLQFIKKNFIGFNKTVITDLDYSKLVKMYPRDAKVYFVQLWCKYNKDYFNITSYSSNFLLWKIHHISIFVSVKGIVIDTVSQRIVLHDIDCLRTGYDVEITPEDYDEIVQLLELDNSIGFIQAMHVFTKYTGKTIDEIDFLSI